MALRSEKVTDLERVNRTRTFVDLAFKDYLGARILLNNNLILQGAILASTSIEKYFKAIAAHWGYILRGHLKADHLTTIQKCDPVFFSRLNLSFLEMLQLVYDLRYLDNPGKPQVGFSVCLEKRPILAELDLFVARLHPKFKFGQGKERHETYYDHLVKKKDRMLWKNNHVLREQGKAKFFAHLDFVYELRIDEHFGVIEAAYATRGANHDGNFLKPGLVPAD